MCNNFVQSLFSLESKTAVVTGAGGFLGRIFSESLLSAGAKVILMGRGDKIKDMADSLRMIFGSNMIDYFKVDFYDSDDFRNALEKVTADNKNVDILLNNAFEFSKETGFNDPSGKIESMSKEQWMRSMEAGVYWHALATQVVGEKMKEQGSGSIINISSMYGIVSPDPKLYEGVQAFNPPSYGAAKAAILAFTRYTASFYGSYGIRCNALAPGAFPNVGNESYNSPKDEGFLRRLSDKTVLKRYGVPDDLKGAIVFLASEASRYITGQVLVVDGGWTII
jgi:gluconate 5-dehydrogenase